MSAIISLYAIMPMFVICNPANGLFQTNRTGFCLKFVSSICRYPKEMPRSERDKLLLRRILIRYSYLEIEQLNNEPLSAFENFLSYIKVLCSALKSEYFIFYLRTSYTHVLTCMSHVPNCVRRTYLVKFLCIIKIMLNWVVLGRLGTG